MLDQWWVFDLRVEITGLGCFCCRSIVVFVERMCVLHLASLEAYQGTGGAAA